jgi:hypothetical protein
MKMSSNKRVNLILNKDKSKKVDLILKADLGTWTPGGMTGTGAAPKGYKPGTEKTAGKKDVVGESSAKKMGMFTAVGGPPSKPAVKVSKEVKAARTKVMPESVMTSAKPIPPAIPSSAKKALDEAIKASKQYGGGMGQIKVRGNVAEYSGSAAKAPISSKPSGLGSGPTSRIIGQGVSDDSSKVKQLAQETGVGHFLSGSKETKKSVKKPEEEPFGKPMYQRKDESTDDFRSRIIRHLIDDKGYAQNRAIAAAYDMSERGGTKKAIDDMLEATKRLRKAFTDDDYAMNALVRYHYHKEIGNNRKAVTLKNRFNHFKERGANPGPEHAKFYLEYHGKQSTSAKNSPAERQEHSKRLEATHTALNELKNTSKGVRLPTSQDLPTPSEDRKKMNKAENHRVAADHLVDHHYYKLAGNNKEAAEAKKNYERYVGFGANPTKAHFKEHVDYHKAGLKTAIDKPSENKARASEIIQHKTGMMAANNAMIEHLGKSMRKALTGDSVPNFSRLKIIGSQEDTYRSATTPVSRATTVLNVDAYPLTPDYNVVPKNEMAVIKSCNCCGRIYKSTTCPTCAISKSYIYKK